MLGELWFDPAERGERGQVGDLPIAQGQPLPLVGAAEESGDNPVREARGELVQGLERGQLVMLVQELGEQLVSGGAVERGLGERLHQRSFWLVVPSDRWSTR